MERDLRASRLDLTSFVNTSELDAAIFLSTGLLLTWLHVRSSSLSLIYHNVRRSIPKQDGCDGVTRPRVFASVLITIIAFSFLLERNTRQSFRYALDGYMQGAVMFNRIAKSEPAEVTDLALSVCCWQGALLKLLYWICGIHSFCPFSIVGGV